MKRKQSISQVRWDLALRYRLIETVAWWEGRLTTGHLMQSFGISRQQASKDINTYITEHASRNLTYDKQIKGYVPTRSFKPCFIDRSASAYLDLLAQNNERAPHVEGLKLAYAHTLVLQVPDRSVQPEILRPLLKACREGLRLEMEYVSLANPKPETRIIDRTRWCTPECAGMFALTARRTGPIVTSCSAVCEESPGCWRATEMTSQRTRPGIPKCQ